MHNILTITLNPAIDKSTTVKAIVPDKKLRCAKPKYEPGGGGVNVSRALKKLGENSTAMYLAGGHSGKFFEELLKEEGVHSEVILTEAITRENLIVVDESANLQYRFGMPGARVNTEEWQQCLQAISQTKSVEFIVASGSLPEGTPDDFFKQLATIAKEKNSKLIVDTSGEPLKKALEAGVYLLKPNLGELSFLYGVEALQEADVRKASQQIIASGKCEVIVVSMGASGAMLITKDDVFSSPSPTVKKRSTVGAGDSMVAGIVLALSRKLPWMEVLQFGIATGTATTMNPGTELCKLDDVNRLFAQLSARNQ